MLRRAAVAVLAPTALALSLGSAPVLAQPDRAPAGQRWASESELMVVQDSRIDEASGLTRSTRHRRTIFVNNDSGDTHRVFAVSKRGKTRGVLTLRGAVAHDWEDIASGPHHFLWVADTGNNGRTRSVVEVIRFREPRKLRDRTVASRTFRLSYPDHAWDAEALMVDPSSARVYVISKSTSGGGIYRAPRTLSKTGVNVLQRVGSAPARITAADFAPGGTAFVLRDYTQAYYYRHLGATPRVIDLPGQSQGESIGFTRNGRTLLAGSEGVHQPVWRLK